MRTLAVIAISWLALGCNQSEPPGPDSGSGSGSYFPLLDGSSYSYLHSKGGWTEVVETLEADDGMFESHQSGDPDGATSVSLLEVAGGDVYRVAEDTFLDGELDYSVEYDPGFLRFSDDWLDAELNEGETLTYQRTETKAGDDPKDPQPRAHTFTVESVSDTVTVPAGTFHDCLRVRRQRALDDPSIDDPTSQEEQDKLYWFAPGVGKVREENTITGSTEVLVVYELGEP